MKINSQYNVLITGTNKGIGYELVKIFLSRNSEAIIYATSRQKFEIASERWKGIDMDNRVKCMFLDISSNKSINEFEQEFKKQKIMIDILINNAGVCKAEQHQKQIPSLEWAKQCLNVNIIGQMNLTEILLPYLSNNCKIVNISSTTGGLKHQPIQTQIKFSDPKITKNDIIFAVEQYLKELQTNQLSSFSRNVYGTSKMLLGAWSRFVIKKWISGNQISICVSPGFCLTSMTENLSENLKIKAYSSQSGALKIYQTISFFDLDPQIFYHRARKSNFMINGEGLPRQ